jgi:hypothetical protein
LALSQEFIGDANTFAEQSTRILAKVEDQALQIAHLVESILHFFIRGLVEAGDVHVADPRTDEEVQIHAVARDFVTNHGEFERLVNAFTQHGDVNRGALRPLQQVSHIGGAHVIGGLAIDCNNDVTGADTRAIGRSADKGRDHDDLIIARTDRHAHAVVLAALIFAKQRISFGIEEIGVRIEHVQHSGYGAVVDCLVRIHRLSVVLLNDCIDIGELPQTVANFGVAAGSRRRADLLTEEHAQNAAA